MTQDPKPLETALKADPELALKPTEKKQNWIKIGVDYGPLIAFGCTFFVVKMLKLAADPLPLVYASAVLAIGSVIALIVGFVAEKRLAWIPLSAAAIGIPFAILTVVFKDPMFVKVKMTIVNVLIASVLLGGLALKKQPLKALVGEALKLKDDAWPKLTLYYALFYLAMAGVNEAIWRTQTDSVWTTWKLFSLIGGPILFSLALFPFLMKNMIQPDEKASDN
ncbi:inner membrane-spanning protein YciB [Asticcacaulis sp. AC402]|uniref:inner membrane-spanning protein YciB n=1 Tax=Asticcacaulis sp. AC402 TaxID=1282361 RepID=UPI0003C3D047|nr:septation protein IspZ [Asticcacaulis sp. AC402]ESQ74812.1 septation protein A [Asticcacaulis sp. AC402]